MNTWTVVSIVPLELRETKNSLKPFEYSLPESDGTTPQVLHVEDIKEIYYMTDKGRNIDLPKESAEVAQAIVNDYKNATWLATEHAYPGLFAVPGKWEADEIAEQFPQEYEKAKEAQHNWLWSLVKQADDDWFKFHQHKILTPMQLKAARMLNIRREWTMEPLNVQMVNCPHCLALINAKARVCQVCTREVNA